MNQTTAMAEPYVDDDSIDPRKYVLVLLHYWWLVVGLGILGALAAVLLSSRAPVVYEATATVLLSKPRYQTAMDSRIQNVADPTPIATKVLGAIANSDEVLGKVASGVAAPAGSAAPTSARLKSSLTATIGGDPTLLLLKARASEPAQAAGLANTWAAAIVERARATYSGAQEITYFEARLADASTRLVKAEADLSAFQGQSELDNLKSQLGALRHDQQASLADAYQIGRMLDETRVLREHLTKYEPETRVPLAGNLTVLLLQARALGVGSTVVAQIETSGAQTSTASTPTTAALRVEGTDATATWKAGDLIKLLDDLSAVLRGRANAYDARASAAAPKLLDLQGQVQRAQAETDRLVLERDVAKEGYQAVARKVEEARIAADGESGQFGVVSQAVVPAAPLAQSTSRNVVMAAGLGLMAGAVLAFVLDWWRQGGQATMPGTRGGAAVSA